jgi:hypothetical protein
LPRTPEPPRHIAWDASHFLTDVPKENRPHKAAGLKKRKQELTQWSSSSSNSA